MIKKKKRKIGRTLKNKMAKTASELTGIKLEDTLLILEGICNDEENKSKDMPEIFTVFLRKLSQKKKYFKNKNKNNENENNNPNPNFIFF